MTFATRLADGRGHLPSANLTTNLDRLDGEDMERCFEVGTFISRVRRHFATTRAAPQHTGASSRPRFALARVRR